jgi:ComF family protein
MFSPGLPSDIYSSARSPAGAAKSDALQGAVHVRSERCLAARSPLYCEEVRLRQGFVCADHKEAVFSSSEDRIRASRASVEVARRPIVFPATASWASRAAESLFSVLFPSDCRICGEPLLNISRLPVWPACLDQMHPVRGAVCSICGELMLSSYAEYDEDGLWRCPVCRWIDRPFVRAVAYGSYDDGLRELVHLLKYNGVRPAAHVLGRMLAEASAVIEPSLEQAKVLVIPVPLYKGKRHGRGFNQAELIARSAIKFCSWKQRLELAVDILLRIRDTHSQIGLTSHRRRENIHGAFSVASAAKVTDREVLLVDDVYATGTTASECARVLREAGAARVWVATVARTLKLASKQEAGIKVAELQGFNVEEVGAPAESEDFETSQL